jgi:4,5-dihydroxyphthalate decarboxylase
MSRLTITLGCGDYDRTRAIADGRVTVEGVDLRCVPLEPEEVFFRMARHREFEVAELSLSTYVITLFHDSPFVAIPVFPSRMFRHGGIFVHEDSGIVHPADLIGKRVGLPEYQLTALVWIRGMLAEHYGVPVNSVSYRTGGIHDAGRIEKVDLSLSPDIDITPIPIDRTLSEMIATGELDALYTPRAPQSFYDEGSVRRLFVDPRAEERRYFETTGIFPIMHTIVIRRDIYEANRWLASSLMKAFIAAKRMAYEDLRRTAALSITLPWVIDEYEATVALLGRDYWSYGLPANIETLKTFLGYSHGQSLIPELLAPADLFAPETLEAVKV